MNRPLGRKHILEGQTNANACNAACKRFDMAPCFDQALDKGKINLWFCRTSVPVGAPQRAPFGIWWLSFWALPQADYFLASGCLMMS